jgi:hypothetical protein
MKLNFWKYQIGTWLNVGHVADSWNRTFGHNIWWLHSGEDIVVGFLGSSNVSEKQCLHLQPWRWRQCCSSETLVCTRHHNPVDYRRHSGIRFVYWTEGKLYAAVLVSFLVMVYNTAKLQCVRRQTSAELSCAGFWHNCMTHLQALAATSAKIIYCGCV